MQTDSSGPAGLRVAETNIVTPKSKLLKAAKELRSRKLWQSLFLGQICSMFVCGTAVTSTWLARRKGVECPTAQSFLNYVLLGSVYGVAYSWKSTDHVGFLGALRRRWWKYLVLGIIDVEANYLMVKAYQYTTLTSVQLLDCTVIPVVLILSYLVLRYRFRWVHYVGVLLCLGGAVCMVVGDFIVKKSDSEAQNRLIGDFMVFGGSVLYAMSNVSEEYVVKKFTRLEFLSMVGMFGSVVSGIQLVVLERHELQNVDWADYEIVLCLLLFAGFLFGLYSLVPYLMRRAGATVFNLSILSADFYALIIGLVSSEPFHFVYFIGFASVIAGLVTYSIHAPSTDFEVSLDTETSTLDASDAENRNVSLVEYRKTPVVIESGV